MNKLQSMHYFYQFQKFLYTKALHFKYNYGGDGYK